VYFCRKCQTDKDDAEFYPDATHGNGHHSVCKECVKADRKRRYVENPRKYNLQSQAYSRKHREGNILRARRRRERVLAEYGGACACCGETTPEFLAIDHVFNDGEAHRRELKGYGRAIYLWLARNGYPKDGRFQLLCHNCNTAKGLYGGCPHQGPVPGVRAKHTALPLEFCTEKPREVRESCAQL
jgi:hypothetical protein